MTTSSLFLNKRVIKMKLLIKNTYTSLRIALTVLAITGFWSSRKESSYIMNYYYPFVTFMFMCGISIIVQFVDLFQIWGDVALMTGSSFLLFTNVALGLKMFNIVWKREEVRAVIEESDRELQAVDTYWGKGIVNRGVRQTIISYSIYVCLAYLTVVGWATGAEKGDLPTRAWYPYSTTTSPGYEITYAHQVVAVCFGAGVNVSLDTVVISLIAQCCCRLQLLSKSLTMLGDGMQTHEDKFRADQELAIKASIQRCVQQHQSVLEAAGHLQEYFSSSILVQLTVSMFILCVTAYQLAFESSNTIAVCAMAIYFLCITLQVFLYCYQGNELSDESGKVGGAVFESPWYKMSVPLRRDLLIIMLRSQKITNLTAGGLTTLSLNTFMAIIKTSYTLFTVIQSED